MIKAILDQLIKEKFEQIEQWFASQYQSVKPVIYSSVDIRHSGFKMAPVDTNLFPAGFNNLNELAKDKAIEQFKKFFALYYPQVRNIILIPEDHTRNLFYLDNIYQLKDMLTKAGLNICLGSFNIQEALNLVSKSEHSITIEPLQLVNNNINTKSGFVADLILLNNDLSDGVIEQLQSVNMPIIPNVNLGWYSRRKTGHFTVYDQVIRNFGAAFAIDPFLISTVFHRCGKVNFKEKQGLECVATGIEKVMRNLREKYKQYGIKDEPYVFVKSDKGTYGMGIMTATSGNEIYEMNKKLRNKMDIIKGGMLNDEIIIQEGVKTIDSFNNNVAEQMVYSVGGMPIANIFRVNADRDRFGNLNAQGMEFEMHICKDYAKNLHKDGVLCKYNAYGLIAKLASLAAAKE